VFLAEGATQTVGEVALAGCPVADVGTQACGIDAAQVAEVATQCTLAEEMEAPPIEISIGRQLHPAQARALERAEEAAARIEQVQAQVEARAARYEVPARTGGRQARKEAVRRRAAAAGMDVLGWTVAKERSTDLADTLVLIEQRLDVGRERWMRQQRGGEVDQRTFLQAAQAAGIEVGVPL
jgi:hypothetical protein